MTIKLPFSRRSDQRGFTHVELFIALAFVAVFSFVGVRVISASHAATIPYATKAQCTLLGRTWNGSTTANPCSKTCYSSTQGSYVVAPIYDYCSAAVTAPSVISYTSCVSYGRVALVSSTLYTGCARLTTQH